MLVCSVSQLRRRAAIAADVAEIAAAVDAPGTGNVVFATLVDDPASVGDHVDAFLGQIMREAANATDYVSWGIVYAATLAEAASALDTASATSTSPMVPTTFDGVTSGGSISLSNGNLTVTESTGNSNTGARSTANKTTGKYYFEGTFVTTSTNTNCIGILASTGTYTNLVSNGTNCTAIYQSGTIFSNDGSAGGISALANGDLVSVAIDLTARKAWFRKGAAGPWNGAMAGNPAAGTGSVAIKAALGFAPAVGFGLFGGGNVLTGNFGATAFTGAVPSGFTAGWPA